MKKGLELTRKKIDVCFGFELKESEAKLSMDFTDVPGEKLPRTYGKNAET